MAKKKREIQKRKKQQDTGPAVETDIVKTGSVFGRSAGSGKAGPRDDGRIPARAPNPVSAEEDAAFSRVKENLLLGLLVIYVLLLGLGTFGELFEVEWILNLPLFK